MFDVCQFRAEFDFFREQPHWVYLDNAATSHKPKAVLQAIQQFYARDNSNVHRSGHQLSAKATADFEQARCTVATFLNAASAQQVIWCSGATAALNQLAFGLMFSYLQPGDRILLTTLEHHANIVPWQYHCQQHGIAIDVVPLDAEHRLDLQQYQQLLAKKPKLVSFSHISNGLGHIQHAAELVKLAKAAGAMTIIDGAQGILHQPVDVQALDCDFYVFSAHKLFGPTGIGVLYGKTAALELLRPLLYGGEMIKTVSFQGTALNQLPYRLEAGTPHIAGAIGLAAAVQWLGQFDRSAMLAHKQKLLAMLYQQVQAIPELQILSGLIDNAGILTLNMPGEHPTDLAVLLDQQQIAVRAGSHCAMPLYQAINQPGALRISIAAYNTEDEIARCVSALAQSVALLA